MTEPIVHYQEVLDKLPDIIRQKAENIAKGLIEQSIDENVAYGIGIYYALKNMKH